MSDPLDSTITDAERWQFIMTHVKSMQASWAKPPKPYEPTTATVTLLVNKGPAASMSLLQGWVDESIRAERARSAS